MIVSHPNIHIILAWACQALSTPNFPVDGGLEQGSLGWKCWNLCILRVLQPQKGEDFVNINFPRLKWVDYFFKMNCWDSPGGDKWFVLFFAPGAGWKWLESIYVRLLLQFSVFSFPGFNNADFNVAQKGCIFPSMICARMWVPKVELSSDDVLCCFLMFDWSISDYLVLFLCFYVNGE